MALCSRPGSPRTRSFWLHSILPSPLCSGAWVPRRKKLSWKHTQRHRDAHHGPAQTSSPSPHTLANKQPRLPCPLQASEDFSHIYSPLFIITLNKYHSQLKFFFRSAQLATSYLCHRSQCLRSGAWTPAQLGTRWKPCGPRKPSSSLHFIPRRRQQFSCVPWVPLW